MSMHKLYKAVQNSMCYVFANGDKAFFIQGRFHTDNEEYIAQLNKEIKNGHPMIFIDPKEPEVDPDKLDPIDVIKRQAVAEYLAAQNKALLRTNDRGNTDRNAPLTGIVNTYGTGEGASDSSSGQDAAAIAGDISSRLAALKVEQG